MSLINDLFEGKQLSTQDFLHILENRNIYEKEAKEKAQILHQKHYGKNIYFRALIEISSNCKQNCYYCGLRSSNTKAQRYRLSQDQILESAHIAYDMGFRTVVMQSGEDPVQDDDFIVSTIKRLKNELDGIAVTLSLGEKSYESYQRFKQAGADRYLLRHETSDNVHYNQLHPSSMSLDNRKRCLLDLKSLGFQVGAGMMIGSPHQTLLNIAKDFSFIQELQPEMIGIGPFIHHEDTPFANYQDGSANLTYFVLSIARLIDQRALIPITTALSTIDGLNALPNAVQSGANVIMINFSPPSERKKYLLYKNKSDYKIEQTGNFEALQKRIEGVGYSIDMQVGNYRR